MAKLIKDLTDAELRSEFTLWDDKVKSATSWGAAVGAADEFRRDCFREMRRRNMSDLPKLERF